MNKMSATNFNTHAAIVAIVFALIFTATGAFAGTLVPGGALTGSSTAPVQGSQAEFTDGYLKQSQNANMAAFLTPQQNPQGANLLGPNGQQLPGVLSSTSITPTPTKYPPTPVINAPMASNAMSTYLQRELQKHTYDGNLARDRELAGYLIQAGQDTVSIAQFPPFVAAKAQAEQSAQVTSAGNAFGDMAKQQSSAAIDFCSKYMINFTQDPNNKWNQLRDQLFVPIGILLLLPGAVLSQMKAIVAAGSPVVGMTPQGEQINCFDGILRSIVAIFLIPGTYLVVNYGIDLSNSLSYTLSSEYTRLFGTNMYNDAICAEIRAHPSRDYQENLGASKTQQTAWPQTQATDWSSLEKDAYESKLDDPCSKTYNAPADRADELMPASAAFSRALSFGGNAALTTAWNVLCAFQMVYLIYLFLVGPVIAGLWVWPTSQLQQALPSWVEGCITICFWSLFWNTVILLMACFKGVTGDTGTIMMSALNFLATSAVKFAFDFTGLIKAAGAEATQKAMAKGGGGNKGAQAKGNPKGANKGTQQQPGKDKPNPKGGPAANPNQPGTVATGAGTPTDGTPATGTTTTGGGGVTPANLASGLAVVPGPTVAPPPSASSTTAVAGAGQSFVGSAQVQMPNGQTYSLDMKVDPANGHQIATLSDAQHHAIGQLDLSAGPSASGTFHTKAGDFKLSSTTTPDGHQFSLTTPDGHNGSLALHNFLNGSAPAANPNNVALPPGSTALADLPGTGTLIQQADGSMAVLSPTSGVHALAANGPTNVDGTMVQVGLGVAPGGQPFMEVSQVKPNGTTDVAMYPQIGQDVGVVANGTTPPDAAVTPSSLAALNALTQQEQHGNYQITNHDGTLQAVGADGKAFAQFDTTKGTWDAMANGQVTDIVAGQNGQWLAGNVPVVATADGGFVAAGTSYAYDAGTSTFSINGDNVPASVLNSELLSQAAMNIPSADITLHELSLPGVAQNLANINTDSSALAQVQQALQGTGVDAQTLYQAAIQHNPLEGVQVMAQALQGNPQSAEQFAHQLGFADAKVFTDAATNPITAGQVLAAEIHQADVAHPGYMHQMAQTLGVSDTVLAGASSNLFYAAQVTAGDAVHYGTPDYVHQVASQIGVSDAVFTSAAQLPVASAQMVAAEAGHSTFLANEVRAELHGHMTPELLHAASVSPIAAGQMVGVAAQYDAPYASYVAQSIGASNVDTVTAAAYYPSAAAQMVGMEAQHSAPYAAAIAQALPNFDSNLITAAATSQVAATQFAAAGAALDSGYAAQVAPAMHLHSMQDFTAVATNPIYAAQALSAETTNNVGYASYVAHSMNLTPEVVQQAATNMVAATQMVAADATTYASSYGTYASTALQVSDPTIMQRASQDQAVAAQVLAGAAASNPDSLTYVAHSLGVTPQVLDQAQHNMDAATYVANYAAHHASLEPAPATVARDTYQYTGEGTYTSYAAPAVAANEIGGTVGALASYVAPTTSYNLDTTYTAPPAAPNHNLDAQLTTNEQQPATVVHHGLGLGLPMLARVSAPQYVPPPAGRMASGVVRAGSANATSDNALPAAEMSPPPKHVAGSLQTQMAGLQRGGKIRKRSEGDEQYFANELARITNSGEPQGMV